MADVVLLSRPPLVSALLALIGCGPVAPVTGALPVAAPTDDPFVVVLGHVNAPRKVRFHRGLDLRGAVRAAGGITPYGHAAAIHLRRTTFDGPAVFLVSAEDGAPRVSLAPGDVVLVDARTD